MIAPPWIALTGGKGGVGKTLLAVNLAISAARTGRRVLLADLDPGLGNVDVHLRLAPRHTLVDVAEGRCDVAAALARGPAGISVLVGERGSTAWAAPAPGTIDDVLRAVERAAEGHDLVICDTGAGIGPATVGAVCRADLALAVTTPDLAAATDAYALIKLLAQRGTRPPTLVVNRARSREQALRTATRLSSVCRRFLRADLPFGGWLADDVAIAVAADAQRPFALRPHGAAGDQLAALTADVLSRLPARRRDTIVGAR